MGSRSTLSYDVALLSLALKEQSVITAEYNSGECVFILFSRVLRRFRVLWNSHFPYMTFFSYSSEHM